MAITSIQGPEPIRLSWPAQKCERTSAVNPRLKILIFAPHPDDETIGAGGLIVRANREIRPKPIICVCSMSLGNQNEQEVRKNEMESACKILGANLIHSDVQLGMESEFVDGKSQEKLRIMNGPENTSRLSEVIREQNPDAIITCHQTDLHLDHFRANSLVTEAIALSRFTGRLIEYGVWRDLEHPNLLIGLSDEHFGLVKDAMQAYSSQVSRNPTILTGLLLGTLLRNVARAEVLLGWGSGSPGFNYGMMFDMYDCRSYDATTKITRVEHPKLVPPSEPLTETIFKISSWQFSISVMF